MNVPLCHGVAFVGAGLVAELHQQALERDGRGYLVGIFDMDEGRARDCAHRWGTKSYKNYEALLRDERVEAVFVLTDPVAHESLAIAALQAGKHVLIEKPVGSVVEIAKVRKKAIDQKLVCMPGHNYAYQPEFTQMRELVHGRQLGKIRAAWITYVIRHPEEIASKYSGILEEVMVHHAYLGVALFGVPNMLYAGRLDPAWVSHSGEDQAWMTWHYSGGMSLHLFASFAIDDETADPWTFIVKVLGDQGGASYTWRSAILRRPLGSLGFGIPAYEDSYRHEQEALFRAMEGDSDGIVSSINDAERVAELLFLADQADRSKSAVMI